MSDEADKGNDTAEVFLAAALQNRKPVLKMHGIGMCLNCGAGVSGENRWCDKDCMKDWEDAQRRR